MQLDLQTNVHGSLHLSWEKEFWTSWGCCKILFIEHVANITQTYSIIIFPYLGAGGDIQWNYSSNNEPPFQNIQGYHLTQVLTAITTKNCVGHGSKVFRFPLPSLK